MNGKFVAREEEKSDVTFISPGKLAKEGRTGIVAVGIYLGSREVESKFGKGVNYEIESLNGTRVVINGAGNLGAQLRFKNIEEGDALQIEYNGKLPMKDGERKGTPAHNFTVVKGDIL